jgi:hypothetical protein
MLKCRECGQLYFFEFYDWIDWEDGRDPQYTTYIPVEIDEEVEDAIMHPLVSGYEVQRYTNPTTETYILFPYDTGHGASELIAASTMEKDFSHCWNYLKRFENQFAKPPR